MAQHEAKDLGLERYWFGNDKADYFAKEALADTWKDGIAYVANRKENSNTVGHMAEQVAEKLLPNHGIPKEARPRNPKITLTVPHQFVWRRDRWFCIGCGGIKNVG